MLDSVAVPRDASQRESRSRQDRIARHGQPDESPFTFWLTGLSGAGKSTLSGHFGRFLDDLAIRNHVLDGDAIRTGLCSGLGFSDADRAENIRRIAEAARLLNQAGVHAIVAVISPLRAHRDAARQIVGSDRFLEIHVATPLATCIERDPKGLYARARCGELAGFTGISAVYEAPIEPDLVIRTEHQSVAESRQVLQWFALTAMARREASVVLSA